MTLYSIFMTCTKIYAFFVKEVSELQIELATFADTFVNI